ncbi:MAG: hypothetical protein QM661_11715 [Solimonas sp.]
MPNPLPIRPRRARTDLAAAAAGVTIAGERPNPTLNAGVMQWDPRAASRGDGIADQPVYASVQMQELIERGGKRDARLQQAHATADAADADLADAQRRVLRPLAPRIPRSTAKARCRSTSSTSTAHRRRAMASTSATSRT